MRAIRLPNGRLILASEAADPTVIAGMTEIDPEHPDYGKWPQAPKPFCHKGERLR
jgi:hypothetical protein